MPGILGTLALRALLCAAVGWMGWYAIGPVALALTAPLVGIALAKPLLELAGALHHAVRARALADIEGRHYAFRGVHVRVIEDEGLQRWIRAADVRRIAGGTDSDHALQLTYGHGYRLAGRPAEPYFSEAALLAHLAHQADPAAARLRLWVERVVVWPAREQRRRLGLAEPAAAEPAPENHPPP
jgi:hypothetical protein